MRKFFILINLIMYSFLVYAEENTLLELPDETFISLYKGKIPDVCLDYYQGKTVAADPEGLQIIGQGGYSDMRSATDLEKEEYVNKQMETLKKECDSKIRRPVIMLRGIGKYPKNLEPDDAQDPAVIERYVELIGYKH
jgi:hypothetical protein